MERIAINYTNGTLYQEQYSDLDHGTIHNEIVVIDGCFFARESGWDNHTQEPFDDFTELSKEDAFSLAVSRQGKRKTLELLWDSLFKEPFNNNEVSYGSNYIGEYIVERV